MIKMSKFNSIMTASIMGMVIFLSIGCTQNFPGKANEIKQKTSAVSDSNYIQNKDSTQNMMGNEGMMGRGMMRNGMMMGRISVDTAYTNTWEAPSSADEIPNPLAGIEKATNNGGKIFNQYCATCHGSKGKGNGPTSGTLNRKPANLTSVKVQSQTDGDIFWKISNGRGNMAAYKSILSKRQRWELVDYIRFLTEGN